MQGVTMCAGTGRELVRGHVRAPFSWPPVLHAPNTGAQKKLADQGLCEALYARQKHDIGAGI
jgi:hypothetical protein